VNWREDEEEEEEEEAPDGKTAAVFPGVKNKPPGACFGHNKNKTCTRARAAPKNSFRFFSNHVSCVQQQHTHTAAGIMRAHRFLCPPLPLYQNPQDPQSHEHTTHFLPTAVPAVCAVLPISRIHHPKTQ
jgi:hypothetical protein